MNASDASTDQTLRLKPDVNLLKGGGTASTTGDDFKVFHHQLDWLTNSDTDRLAVFEYRLTVASDPTRFAHSMIELFTHSDNLGSTQHERLQRPHLPSADHPIRPA
jgi:hypothetical protein